MTETPTGGEWTPSSQPAPHGQPVLAEYQKWNNPKNPVDTHVVWWWEGEWRLYPQTDGKAYCDRWKPMPATTDLQARVEALERAVRDAAALPLITELARAPDMPFGITTVEERLDGIARNREAHDAAILKCRAALDGK